MGFLKKIFNLLQPKEARKIGLLQEELKIWIEQDVVNTQIRKAEEEFNKEMTEAKEKGDKRLEIAARKKLSRAYKESNYLETEKRAKELLDKQINLI